MGIFKQCKKSPDGKHHWVKWESEGHVVLHCKWCSVIHKRIH